MFPIFFCLEKLHCREPSSASSEALPFTFHCSYCAICDELRKLFCESVNVGLMAVCHVSRCLSSIHPDNNLYTNLKVSLT